MSNAELQVVRRLTLGQQLRQAAAVFYYAFAQKVDHLEFFPHSAEQARRILARVFNVEMGFYALQDGEVVGVVGMQRGDDARFLNFTWRVLREEFGLLGGTWRYLWHKLIHLGTRARRDEIRIEGIAVSEKMRGRGVGTLLLDAVTDYARSLGYRAVVLEVVNTNPRALELYQRLGFVITKTEWYGPVTEKAGFTGATYMRKAL